MRIVANSLHDEVAAQLRERIFAGEWPPGTFLDEIRLAQEMRISRMPLREALKVLTVEGLVRHEPRRGCFVNEVTEQDLDEIFPVIALLEGRCAYEAAQNARNARTVGPRTPGSPRSPAASGAATTRRFLVHCLGRRDLSTAPARITRASLAYASLP